MENVDSTNGLKISMEIVGQIRSKVIMLGTVVHQASKSSHVLGLSSLIKKNILFVCDRTRMQHLWGGRKNFGVGHVPNCCSPKLGQTTEISFLLKSKLQRKDHNLIHHKPQFREKYSKYDFCHDCDYKRRCTKFGYSLKPQLQNKMHQIVSFIVKIATAKEDASCVVRYQS